MTNSAKLSAAQQVILDAPAGVLADDGPGGARAAGNANKEVVRQAILEAPVLPTLLKLAVPTTVVLLAQTAVHVAEAAYVGRLGTAPLAGVALVFPLFMLMMTMSNSGIGSGVASAVARSIGSNRKSSADALVWHAVILAVGFGLLFTVGAFAFGPTLYRAMGGEGASLAAAVSYSNYLFLGSIPVWTVNLLASALRGAGNVKVPAVITLVGAAVLIPFSPALIFGLGPIPAMGIAGAGVAFALYYCGAALVLIRYMTSGRSGLLLRRGAISSASMKDVLRVGIPVAVSTVQTNLTVIVVTGAVGLFGIPVLAGYGNAARLDYVMIPLAFGIATAVLTMVGVNVGAGQIDRARRIGWLGGLTGGVLCGLIGLLAAIFPELWLHLFSSEPQVVAPAKLYMHIVAPFYGVFGLGFVLGFAAQGAGRGMWPFLAATARMLVAGGIGWLAVTRFDAQLATLAAIVAASFVASTLVAISAMFSRTVWPASGHQPVRIS